MRSIKALSLAQIIYIAFLIARIAFSSVSAATPAPAIVWIGDALIISFLLALLFATSRQQRWALWVRGIVAALSVVSTLIMFAMYQSRVPMNVGLYYAIHGIDLVMNCFIGLLCLNSLKSKTASPTQSN